jgi:serine/threonine protein kinase
MRIGTFAWVQCGLSVGLALDIISRMMLNWPRSDLKPENILLDYTGHIALCDFGLSPTFRGRLLSHLSL